MHQDGALFNEKPTMEAWEEQIAVIARDRRHRA
jgi:hypothetical protein